MNSWSINSQSYDNGFIRGNNHVGYESYETIPFRNRQINSHYTSYMDVSRPDDSISDFGRKFSWRSPLNKPQPERSQVSVAQRHFESAFKTAISKMKESSISRVDSFNNSSKSFENQSVIDDIHHRNYMTLQPRKTVTDNTTYEGGHQIFRCNSTADKARDRITSVSVYPTDYSSEKDIANNKRENQYQSVSNLSLNQESHTSNSTGIIPIKSIPANVSKLYSGSRIIIPVASTKSPIQSTEKTSSLMSETHISQKTAPKAQSALPNQHLPSLQHKDDDIITKQPPSTYQSDDDRMSKSLIINPGKPPMKKLPRSVSQKSLERSATTNKSEQLSGPLKPISGLYKKNSSTPLKENSINDMPANFQKLHLAFLDQKKEIQTLKSELAERKAYIVKLETEIRSYEPWR